ncbi:MAG: ABC transporter permease, partial [Thermomicrobiales bacterium]
MNFEYLTEHWRRVLSLTQDHLVMTMLALGLAILVAIPLGLIAARIPKLTLPVLSLLGAIYTIPSLAFLAFLIPSLGLGRKPAIVVLAAYAQISLVRNIVAGLQSVDRSTLEAARGVG